MDEATTTAPDPFERVAAPLSAALRERGFTALTPVQTAVLEAADRGRDLRIVSRTGSGKTVALGLAIATKLLASGTSAKRPRGVAHPLALVVAPTRELAAQVGAELAWLFAVVPLRVATVTGGTALGGDFRTLEANPHVVVGTPGRLVDHLERGSLELGSTAALVLDEADAMLDLGFADELERILSTMPEERSTHLVSATFADEVLELADRNQRDPLLVRGEGAGRAHADIEHVGLIVRNDDRVAVLVNLLLAEPDERTLVFVRTREATGFVAGELGQRGFRARALSGEMSQRERSATLDAFRDGSVNVLVATDVAARGLDVPGIGRVVHYDPPGSPETLTHRAGRTGRAGQKGKSLLLVSPGDRSKVGRLVGRAGIKASLQAPMPVAKVLEAIEHRALHELAKAELAEKDDERFRHLARTLLEARDPESLVAVLLARSGIEGPCAPMEFHRIDPDAERRPRAPEPREGGPRRPGAPLPASNAWVPFQVSWGGMDGADPRRLLAVVCRRGGVSREEVGGIRVLDRSSLVEIVASRAEEFESRVQKPDPRDPHVRFRRYAPEPPRRGGHAAPRRRQGG